MDYLLPYYEAELAALREQSQDFARRYPRIAGRLSEMNELPRDPHVERLIQAFALLSARIHKRLDDDFPLLTGTLLDLLVPQDLRPFPSCAIARFDVDPWVAPGTATVVPRGTVLDAITGPSPFCRFTTTAATQLLPLRVVSASCCSTVAAPADIPVPPRTATLLSLRLELVPQAPGWEALGVDHVRLFLDGDASLVTLLRETLCHRVLATLIQGAAQGPWQADAAARPRAVGLEEDEALIDADARIPHASRLLTEYFAFPEKFNFIDLPLPAAARVSHRRELSLHFALAGPIEPDTARLLELVSAGNFMTGCVPVINLFRCRAEPIRVDHRATMYTVLPSAAAAAAHEVYAIDRVLRNRETGTGSRTESVAALHALRHEALLRDGPVPRLCWWAQRNSALAACSPGHEMEIGLLDTDFAPARAVTDTLSIELRATNRDLPTRMRIGQPGGDLVLADGGTGTTSSPVLRLLRKPTPPRRFEAGGEGLWRLVSHLTLSHASPLVNDIDMLRALLHLHDLPRSVQSERLMAGLQAVKYQPAEACVTGNPYATVVHGTQVRLVVDERHFVGSGLCLFAEVLERCLGLQARLNSFTQLQLLSARTGEVLWSGPRRSGAAVLA